MGTLALADSPDMNGNCPLWIIFIWLVAAVSLPSQISKYNREKHLGLPFEKQMPAAEKEKSNLSEEAKKIILNNF